MSLFREAPPSALVEFDGSLTGVGFRVFALDPTGETLLAAGGISCHFGLDGDSSFQNAMELTALVAGVSALGGLGLRDLTVRLRGDSVSVLQWVSGGSSRVNSCTARSPAMALSALCTHLNVVFDPGVIHIPSAENAICDTLSRGDTQYLSTLPAGARALGASDPGIRFLSLCNPRASPTSDEDMVRQWSLVDQLVSDLPPLRQ